MSTEDRDRDRYRSNRGEGRDRGRDRSRERSSERYRTIRDDDRSTWHKEGSSTRHRSDRDSRGKDDQRDDRGRDRRRDDDRERTSDRRREDRDADRKSGSTSKHRHEKESARSRSRSKTRRVRDDRSDQSDNGGRDKSRHKKSRRDGDRETSEERTRRKAERKKEKEDQKKSIEDAMTNYSNSDNPFNDVNLAQKFTWAKKREVEKKKGISASEASRRDAARREEAKEELEKLNKKRAEREKEREEREEELIRIQRASEQAQLGDWQAKEDEFHLEQAKRRAEIRIKQHRAKPIDVLAINVRLISDNFDLDKEEEEEEEEDLGLEIDVEEPYRIFDNLTLPEVKELFHDIKFYLSLDKDDTTTEFWRAILIVCEDVLSELEREQGTSNKNDAVAPKIAADIANMLSGKTYEQLTLLQGQFQRKLGGGGAIDVEYWEAVLKSLIVWKAKAKLKMMHQVILQKRLEQLKRRQQREAEREKSQLASVLAMQNMEVEGDSSAAGQGVEHEGDEEGQEDEGDESTDMDGLLTQTVPYERVMSPEPMKYVSLADKQIPIVQIHEDWAELLEQRRKVLRNQFNPKKRAQPAKGDSEHPDDEFVSKLMFDREAAKQLAGDEETFNVEASLQTTGQSQQQTYMWQDKYRPRRPRYFNRVHTGYEWNKYNQTHYDHDNPPPKVVQGYKFNLFYPDLIDKSKAPTYKIEKEPGTTDTVLIRFTAGPPYEDIAFRIVNREWEHSHKKGYKSVFDRGVLQLHFNFKRHYYRR